jgi:hypothetical protein
MSVCDEYTHIQYTLGEFSAVALFIPSHTRYCTKYVLYGSDARCACAQYMLYRLLVKQLTVNMRG